MLRILCLGLSVLVLALVVSLVVQYDFPRLCINSRVIQKIEYQGPGGISHHECFNLKDPLESQIGLAVTDAEAFLFFLEAAILKGNSRLPKFEFVFTDIAPYSVLISGNQILIGTKVLNLRNGIERAIAQWWVSRSVSELESSPIVSRLISEALVDVYSGRGLFSELNFLSREFNSDEEYMNFSETCMLGLMPIDYESVCRAYLSQLESEVKSPEISKSWSAFPILKRFIWNSYRSYSVVERIDVFSEWLEALSRDKKTVPQFSPVRTNSEMRNLVVSLSYFFNVGPFGERVVDELVEWLRPNLELQSGLDFSLSSKSN